MKYINKIILATVLMFSVVTAGAQGLKIGHVNSTEIMTEMPSVKDADTKLQAYTQQLEMQLQAMYAEYQTKGEEYQKNETTYEDVIKEIKAKEIMDLESRIQSFQQSAQEKVEEKRGALWPYL